MQKSFTENKESMAFEFSKTDNIEELHPAIKQYFESFVINRAKAFDQLEAAVENGNFMAIRDYCHDQLGVAASYNCFKLEEAVLYIQDYARKEQLSPIKEILPKLGSYLRELQQKYSC